MLGVVVWVAAMLATLVVAAKGPYIQGQSGQEVERLCPQTKKQTTNQGCGSSGVEGLPDMC
jgi:hypothetical protein